MIDGAKGSTSIVLLSEPDWSSGDNSSITFWEFQIYFVSWNPLLSEDLRKLLYTPTAASFETTDFTKSSIEKFLWINFATVPLTSLQSRPTCCKA